MKMFGLYLLYYLTLILWADKQLFLYYEEFLGAPTEPIQPLTGFEHAQKKCDVF